MKILFSPSETKIAGGVDKSFDKDSFIFPELFEKRMQIVKQYNDFITSASKDELIKLFGTKKENVLRLYNKYQKLFGAPLWKKNIMEAQVCDGYGYTLQITYKDGRKRVIEGDIGGGTIDGIMGNYLKKIFGRNYDD